MQTTLLTQTHRQTDRHADMHADRQTDTKIHRHGECVQLEEEEDGKVQFCAAAAGSSLLQPPHQSCVKSRQSETEPPRGEAGPLAVERRVGRCEI